MSRLAVSPRGQAERQTLTALLGVGTAAPANVAQEQTLELARVMAGQTPGEQTWLSRVFLRSGIESRGTVLAEENQTAFESLRGFYPPDANPTTAARMAQYAMHAPLLAKTAAQRALADAGTLPQAITHLITVSCTGFFAPGLDTALIMQLGLSPTLRRLHVGFMGCHAAFNALAAARDAVLADPQARVLVCCVELCSLHFAYGLDPGKLIANALFADGAAAAVIGRSHDSDDHPNAGAWRLHDTASLLLPDSLDAMTWRIGDHGFEMTLLPNVPVLIRQHLRAWCQSWLARHDLQISDIASWAIHPGGPRILAAVAESLQLDPGVLRYSRDVLAHHGNMSSATVLFILKQMIEQSAAVPCVAIGLGPGLMAEGMLFKQ